MKKKEVEEMAKPSAPKLKAMKYYEELDLSINPFVKIGDLIEDHNWVYQFNIEKMEFEKVPTNISYAQCKGCPACQEISELGVKLTDWKTAQIVVLPIDQWERKDLLWLLNQKYSMKDVCDSCVGGKKAFDKLLMEKFRKSKEEAALEAIWYGTRKDYIKFLCAIDSSEYSVYYKKYMESHPTTQIGFLEKAPTGAVLNVKGVA